MINFYNLTNETKREHNPKWPYIPGYPYRILTIGGSGSGKTNAQLILIDYKNVYGNVIEKIYNFFLFNFFFLFSSKNYNINVAIKNIQKFFKQ